MNLPTDTSPEEADPALEPGYFLAVSRLLPYKNVLPIIEAFGRMPYRRLVVVGSGPQKATLQNRATANVAFLEELTDAQMASVYRRCSGLVAASFEDFGLTPLEAAAHGKPCAVLRWGGFLDTVIDGQTGLYFERPLVSDIVAAVEELSEREWDPIRLKAHAQSFGETVFVSKIRTYVQELLMESDLPVHH
ncbi:glycosyltransferase [Nocardioides ferulae]|uniref:glycosyltransferase n=1 Tax=Nocardioides ferulae TaxID=2340821 RepID=UPI001F0C5E4E|nr:glycosyltransferase [Nocardioides ferulae]